MTRTARSHRRALLALVAALVPCAAALAFALHEGSRTATEPVGPASAIGSAPTGADVPSQLVGAPPVPRVVPAESASDRPATAEPSVATGSAVPAVPVASAGVLGRIVQADGTGAESVDVALEPLVAGASRSPWRTTSGIDGLFQLTGVPAGDHRLVLGEPDAGSESFFVEHLVHVEPPTTLLEDVVLPDLGELEVRVVDELGHAVPDARVVCAGHPRGRREATTDANGIARFRELPLGEGRIHARHALGRGNLPFALTGSEGTPVEVVLVGAGAEPLATAAAARARAGGREGSAR